MAVAQEVVEQVAGREFDLFVAVVDGSCRSPDEARLAYARAPGLPS